MIDLTFEILKAKYAPDSLLQQVEVAEPEPVEVQKTITLIMSSADYTDKQITEAVTAYNRQHPEHMSHSFQLPVTMYGIPANSWVLVLPERGTE